MRKMKMNAVFFVYLIAMLLVACKGENKDQFVAEIPYYTKLISNKKETLKLWKKAIHEGDFKAYNEISNAYLLSTHVTLPDFEPVC